MSRLNKDRLHVFARRGAVVAMALTLGLTPVPYITREAIAMASSNATVSSWDATCDGSSYVFTINASDSVFSVGGSNNTIAISYDDGTQGNANALILTWNCSEVKGGYWQDIPGASTSIDGNTITVTVPASYFGGKSFSASYCGSTKTSAEMGGASTEPEAPTTPETPDTPETPSTPDAGDNSGTDAPTTPETPDTDGSNTGAAYTGISIDGDFSDWDGVAKVDTDATVGWGHVNKMAMVWDGDWVYLYLESDDDNPRSMTGAGPSGNGQFAITTDLGNQTLIDLRSAPGEVRGIDGASIAANSTAWAQKPFKWEVAIPTSALGFYSKTIGLGFYQVDPIITNIANLHPTDDGDHTFNGITYDGKYDDWDYYPHTTIQYAGSGTSETVVDARGALYADTDKLYGHVATSMPAHLGEAGGEFTSAVSLKLNDDENLMLTPRFIAVDASGNINWNPQTSGLAPGTYEFYLASTTTNGTSTNINDLKDDDVIYGRAMVTVGADKDEMEYVIDIPTLAAHLHANRGQAKEDTSIDPSSITKFSAQYGRIGQEWVTTAGTSTMPVLGVGLCLAAVGGTYAHRRRTRR